MLLLFKAFLSSLLLLLSAGYHARAGPTNVTIDDTFQGEGAVIQYFPASIWQHGSACGTCPSPLQAYDGTWQDITYDGPANGVEVPYSMSIIFNGTAIYAYTIIVPNYAQSYVNITIDGQPAGEFNGSALNSDNGLFQYNVPMCSITGLQEGQHILQLSAGGPQASLLLFDYAIYTVEDASSSSAPGSVTYEQTKIDDTYVGPDAVIQYNPASEWIRGTPCSSGCVNPQEAYNGTWQDITFDPTVPGRNLPVSMTIIFTGTGITAYTISVPNYAPSNLNITLDGTPAGQYVEPVGGTEFEYNVPMASFSNLTNDRHILMLTAGPTTEIGGNLLLFDYAVITTVSNSSGGSGSGSTATSDSGSSVPSQTTPSSSTSTSTPSSSSSSSSGSNGSAATKGNTVTAIAGVFFGGVVALVIPLLI